MNRRAFLATVAAVAAAPIVPSPDVGISRRFIEHFGSRRAGLTHVPFISTPRGHDWIVEQFYGNPGAVVRWNPVRPR